MNEILYILIGLAAGAVFAWFAAGAMRKNEPAAGPDPELRARAAALEEAAAELRRRLDKKDEELAAARAAARAEGEKRSAAEARLEEALKNVEEQKKLLGAATEKLTESFKALSLDALKSNSNSFMEMARQTMENTITQMKGDMGKRQQEISALVKPLNDTLKNYEEHLKQLEVSRQRAYTSLEEHIKSLGQTNVDLKKETDNLVKALRRPEVRGKWGEFTLKRTAELAGMVERCDFIEQETADGEEGRFRPDMIVNLPSGRRIVVDSKAPLDAYLDMLEAGDEAARDEARRKFGEHIKRHMRNLSSKEYWRRFNNTPEFVVMFLPGESFLSVALEVDRNLIEEGFESKVILATPTTLVALLKAVAYGWRQEQLADEARNISELGRDLYERINAFTGHMAGIRTGIGKAVDSYNKAVGSLEHKVLPGVRRFKELGVQTKNEIEIQEPLDVSLREIGPAADTGDIL